VKPAPIRRPGFVVAALVLLAVVGYVTQIDDEHIGAEQIRQARAEAQRDRHERYVEEERRALRAQTREGRTQ
jgi:hypothetical protein